MDDRVSVASGRLDVVQSSVGYNNDNRSTSNNSCSLHVGRKEAARKPPRRSAGQIHPIHIRQGRHAQSQMEQENPLEKVAAALGIFNPSRQSTSSPLSD